MNGSDVQQQSCGGCGGCSCGQAQTERAPADAAQWQEAPLEALITHLLERYHRPLWADLETLDRLAVRVLEVHGAKEPERLGRLLAALRALQDALGCHLNKEERVLFPWIVSGRQPAPVMPIQVMQMEHARIESLLEELHTLTDHFQPPEDACSTWRALWEGLARLDRELQEHTWLEDEVLFPRALAQGQGVQG